MKPKWIVGNTFPFIVFTSFGAFWLTFACVLDPTYGSWSNYATSAADPASGLQSVGFNASFGTFNPLRSPNPTQKSPLAKNKKHPAENPEIQVIHPLG